MKVKTITYDNAIVKVHMPDEIDTERLKYATVKFMLGVLKEGDLIDKTIRPSIKSA